MAELQYIDPTTGRTYPVGTPLWRAESGSHLNLTDAPGIARADIDSSQRSLWRYARAIGVDATSAVTLGEGWTPLVHAAWDGVQVAMKLEYVSPSGSFKD